MRVNFELETLRAMDRYGWRSKTFARAYVLARRIDGLSHQGAIRAAVRTPGVRPGDVPAGV